MKRTAFLDGIEGGGVHVVPVLPDHPEHQPHLRPYYPDLKQDYCTANATIVRIVLYGRSEHVAKVTKKII